MNYSATDNHGRDSPFNAIRLGFNLKLWEMMQFPRSLHNIQQLGFSGFVGLNKSAKEESRTFKPCFTVRQMFTLQGHSRLNVAK